MIPHSLKRAIADCIVILGQRNNSMAGRLLRHMFSTYQCVISYNCYLDVIRYRSSHLESATPTPVATA